MRRLTLGLLSVLLLAAGPKLTPEEVVEKCVKVVRASVPYSRFDAYVTSRGTIAYFGTDEERFQFEKCLDQHGYPEGSRGRR